MDEKEIDDLEKGGRDIYGNYWDLHPEGLPECLKCTLGVSEENPDGYCIFDKEASPRDICPAGIVTDNQRKMSRAERDKMSRENHRKRIIGIIINEVEPLLPAPVRHIAKITGYDRGTIHSWGLAKYLFIEIEKERGNRKIAIVKSVGEKTKQHLTEL